MQEGSIVLTAHDSIYDGAITCDAVLFVNADGTWSMDLTVYGNAVAGAVTGVWVKDKEDGILLTVEQTAEGVSIPESFRLACDGETGAYTGEVAVTCMQNFGFNLNFA